MAFEHLNLFGNVIDIVAPASGKIKYVKLAQSTFSSDRSKKSPFYNVVVFEKDFDKIAEIEEALAEVRAQKGNDKAALTGVKLDVFVNPQTGEDGRDIQLQFSKVVKPAEAAKAEAVAEA